MKKLYKVLNADLTSPFQSFQFELGKEYHCENFDTDKSQTCSRGFYAVDIDGLPYAYNVNRKIFEVVVSGKKVEIDCFKRRYENIVIVSEADMEDVIPKAKKLEKKLGYKLSEVLNPIYPLLIMPSQIDNNIKKLLKDWDSVRDSVRASVRASVWDSVRDSVEASVWDSVRASVEASVRASVGDSVEASVWDSVRASVEASVWASVWDSVRASVWAYISSMFPFIKKWKYVNHEQGVNPFQPCIDLWHMGLIPSFDGKIWRLHGGKEAKVLYEISKKEFGV